MAKAVPSAPKSRKQTGSQAPDFRAIPLDQLVPTRDNRRKRITNASVQSLADSIREEGILQPIVVRPHPTERGKFEIRAGERRFRAAKLARLDTIPAIVREMDDATALAVTVLENLQRRDLAPLEQAETIDLAFKQGFDLKAVASKLGLSEQQTARRAKLVQLNKTWKQAIQDETSEASRLTLAHLELVARLPHATQEALADEEFDHVFQGGFPTVADLERLIDGGLRTLKAMPWKLDDDTLVPEIGACRDCQKRSGMQPLLFDADDQPTDGKVSKTDRCLDPGCFETKLVHHVQHCETEHRGTHKNLQLVVLDNDRLRGPGFDAFSDRTERLYNASFVKKGGKGTVPVMPVTGPRAGKLLFVKRNSQVHRSTVGGRGGNVTTESKPQGPLPLKERRIRLKQRRFAWVIRTVKERLEALTEKEGREFIAVLTKRKDDAAKAFDPLALLLAFGTTTHQSMPTATEWATYRLYGRNKSGLNDFNAVDTVRQVWIHRLRDHGKLNLLNQIADCKEICALLAWDFEALEKDAEAKIPTPKSWSKLKADGTPKR